MTPQTIAPSTAMPATAARIGTRGDEDGEDGVDCGENTIDVAGVLFGVVVVVVAVVVLGDESPLFCVVTLAVSVVEGSAVVLVAPVVVAEVVVVVVVVVIVVVVVNEHRTAPQFGRTCLFPVQHWSLQPLKQLSSLMLLLPSLHEIGLAAFPQWNGVFPDNLFSNK